MNIPINPYFRYNKTIMSVIKQYHFDEVFRESPVKQESRSGVIKSSRTFRGDRTTLATQRDTQRDTSNDHDDEAVSLDDVFDDGEGLGADDPSLADSVDASDSAEPGPPPPNEDDIRASIMADVQDHVNDLLGAIDRLNDARDSVMQSARDGLVGLAIQIAEKVICASVDADSSLIRGIIDETFDKIAGSDRVTFRVHPDDGPTVQAYESTIQSRLVGVESITIQPDVTIQSGGCLIETDLGAVDITIREKLNLITQTFRQIQRQS